MATAFLSNVVYWTVFARNRDTALPAEGTGDLQILICVQLQRDPDGVTHCRILSSDKAEWRLIPATLCRWRRCFLADQFHDTHTRRRSYCWTLIGNRTQGIQSLRVTPNVGSEPPFWNSGVFVILLQQYSLLFDFRQFHVAPQMLSTQCDCHNLLITLIAGLCLQHLTAVHEVRFAILLWFVVRIGLHLPKLSYTSDTLFGTYCG